MREHVKWLIGAGVIVNIVALAVLFWLVMKEDRAGPEVSVYRPYVGPGDFPRLLGVGDEFEKQEMRDRLKEAEWAAQDAQNRLDRLEQKDLFPR